MLETKLRSPQLQIWEEHETPAAGSKSVYLEARREWNERYGEYIAREHAWKSGFFIMGVITVMEAAIGMDMHLGNPSLPYPSGRGQTI